MTKAETTPAGPFPPRADAASRRELVGPPDLRTGTGQPVEPQALRKAAELAREDRVPLAVRELRLCRRILGFGAYEPIAEGPVHPGQSVLIYAELAGLRYQTREKTHVARLSARVELYASDGTCVWQEPLGEAEDECLSRRSDNFLGCRVTIPASLPPGPYRLKLVQTDLVARQSAAGELSLAVSR